MGHGWVECQHGRIPLPAPATVEILKGAPVYSANVEGELVTPTGAAIVKTLAHSFGHMPQMRVQNTGYGAGNTEFPFPNLLRVFVGETDSSVPFHKVSIVETNIDDMNPEFYNSAMEKLFLAGALDVFTTPICMKKNRPGALLTVICPEEKAGAVSEVVLRETTSFGVRVTSGERRCLDRRWVDAETEFGTVKVKVGSLRGEDLTVSPEYEDCKKAAEIAGVPVRRVYEEAAEAFKRGQKQ
ncbi:MAG TPA: TIGR00299 family protein, partial [Armatimonadetes bacterium]|nr:TIGR00299 family protein [Armatimonadota bacterium]